MEEWKAAHPAPAEQPAAPEVETFKLPPRLRRHGRALDNFFRAVKTREHVVEDEVFGNNAAIGCHMANYSYFHKAIARWDGETNSIKS